MAMIDVEAKLGELAAGQWGLFTTPQAQDVGVSRAQLSRLAIAGALLRLAHGVYAQRGSTDTRLLDLRAAWLATDPTRTAGERLADGADGVVVSHASATAIYGFGDLTADRHEFTTARRKQTRRDDVRFHRTTLTSDEVTIHDGLPVTTVEHTIVDLLSDGHDGEHVAAVLADAVRARMVDTDQLAEALMPFAARFGQDNGDGRGALTHLLDLGGAQDQVVAGELAAVARSQNQTLAELVGGWLTTQSTMARLAAAGQALQAASLPHIDPAILDAINSATRLDPAMLEAVAQAGTVSGRLDPQATPTIASAQRAALARAEARSPDERAPSETET